MSTLTETEPTSRTLSPPTDAELESMDAWW